MLMRILMLMARSSAWSPASLFAAGEQGVWYDPSDFSTMFQDSAGTIPVTAVEQPVGRILDKSGRGNHATQTTVPKRPILKIDGNGKYYLKFDGIDDALSTASINFTSTDKMTVVAGVRKLSDAAIGMVAETSVGQDSNMGSFLVHTKTEPAGYRVATHGDTSNPSYGYVDYSVYAAPISNVVTSQMALNQVAASDKIKVRINGASPSVSSIGSSGRGIGAGTYGNYPLFIGSRAGTSLPFNGHLYSLVIRGAQSTEAQILSAETYCNQKTGAY